MEWFSQLLCWWEGLSVAIKASVIIAFWKTVEVLWSVGKGAWRSWQEWRDRDIRNKYPDLYERLNPGERWMLRDSVEFSRPHLYGYLIQEEIEKRRTDKMDFELQLDAWNGREVSPDKIPEWIHMQRRTLERMTDSIKGISKGLTKTFDPDDDKIDIKKVVHISEKAGRIYEEAIHLGIRYQQTYCKENNTSLFKAFSKSVHSVIESIEGIQGQAITLGERSISKHKEGSNMPWNLLKNKTYAKVAFYMEKIGLWNDKSVAIRDSFEIPSDPMENLDKEIENFKEEYDS